MYTNVAVRQLMEKELSNLTETAYGEPQLTLYFANKRYLEITKEEIDLPIDETFYSVRYNCNQEEFDNNQYQKTCGIIDSWCTPSIQTSTFLEEPLIAFLTQILTAINENMEEVRQ